MEKKKEQTDAKDDLAALVKEGLEARRQKKKKEELEEQYIDVEDKVAVLDISLATMDIIDGIPGTHTEPTGELTKQGLPKMRRYKLVKNYIPEGKLQLEVSVVPKEEWEAHVAKSGINPQRLDTELGLRARRAGGGMP